MSQPLWGMKNAHLAPSKIVKPFIVRTEAYVPHSALYLHYEQGGTEQSNPPF